LVGVFLVVSFFGVVSFAFPFPLPSFFGVVFVSFSFAFPFFGVVGFFLVEGLVSSASFFFLGFFGGSL
jgi:hypothetical protein